MTDDAPLLSAFDSRCDLPGALAAWREIVGTAYVHVDDATLDRYARSTSATSRRPAAVVQPANRDDIVAIVQVARRCRTPLYPISTGQNWGYGDACAVHDGQVIVELRRMNRIVEVDRELGYAVIEPGVTQRQLWEYLAANNVPFWMDSTGAGPHSSLVGCGVERGCGHTPNGNRFQTISGMEIVLGSGEILRTGFGHYEGAKTTHLYPYGIGPYLDGLFTQSNFGIVTRIGFWLLPKPEAFCPYLVLFADDDDLYGALPRLRELRMNRVLSSVPHIGNDLRALSSAGAFPRDKVPTGARLTEEVRRQMRRDAGIGLWSMSGAFYGTPAEVRLHKGMLRKALRGFKAKTIFLPDHLLQLGKMAAIFCDRLGIFRGLGDKVRAAAALASIHRGRSTGYFMRGSFWRRRGGWPADLDGDVDLPAHSVGITWMAPIVPFRATDLRAVSQAMDSLFEQHGFDCHVTVNMVNERSLAAVYTIHFDAEDGAETARAAECYRASVGKLYAMGYPLYRASIAGMSMVGSADTGDVFWKKVREIKRALDPDGIIAPGRYGSA